MGRDQKKWKKKEVRLSVFVQIPGGNTGEIKAARKGTGHPTSHADGPG